MPLKARGLYRRSGISPCPEEFAKVRKNAPDLKIGCKSNDFSLNKQIISEKTYKFVNLDGFWRFQKENYILQITDNLLSRKNFQRRICFLNNINFRMYFHTEAVEDIFLHLTTKSNNLLARCTSFIYKNKSLLVMNSSTSESLSFPTALVD